MKGLKAPVDFTGFILISEIKPGKDELIVEAAPIRSVLQPWITRIPGAENGRSNDGGLLTCNPTRLNLPFSLRIKFCYFIYLLLYSFLPQIRSLLLQPSISTASMPIGIVSPVFEPLAASALVPFPALPLF